MHGLLCGYGQVDVTPVVLFDLERPDAARRSARHPDGAYGYLLRPTCGPGQPGCGYGEVGAQGPASPLDHCHGHLFANGRLLFDEFVGHPEHALLYLVGVRNDAPLEILRRPGHRNDGLGYAPAGAALGGGNRQPPSCQRLHGVPLGTAHVHAVHVRSQPLPHRLHERRQQAFAVRLRSRLCGEPQLHLRSLGIGCQRGIHGVVHQVAQLLLHLRLRQPEHVQRVGQNHALLPRLQIGEQGVVGEIAALVGHSRQHGHRHAVRRENAARGGAHRIVQHRAALGQIRLPAVAVRHFPPENVFEIAGNFLHDILVKFRRHAEGGAYGVFRQVVIGRPQPADENEQVAALAGNVRHLPQPLRIVAHHRVVQHVHPHGGQLFRYILGVGVGHVAQQQLRAYGNDLGMMKHSDRSLTA